MEKKMCMCTETPTRAYAHFGVYYASRTSTASSSNFRLYVQFWHFVSNFMLMFCWYFLGGGGMMLLMPFKVPLGDWMTLRVGFNSPFLGALTYRAQL